MRTNAKYGFRDGLIILTQFFLGKFSLWYFKRVNNKKVTLIRRQGIGDAIFCTGVLYQFKNENPNTQIKLVSNNPDIFEEKTNPSYSLADFPLVWLTYGHYDFPLLKRKDKHITKIIAEFLGISSREDCSPRIKLKEEQHHEFISNHIKTKNYIVFHPWAGKWNTERNWSKSKWDTLAKMLSDLGYDIYQVGGKGDLPIEGARHWNGIASLQESLLLIKNAELLIGVNSFAEQAAGAFKVKSVILYGPTNPVYSLNDNQVAISGKKVIDFKMLPGLKYKFDRVENISCSMVYDQAIRVLGNTK